VVRETPTTTARAVEASKTPRAFLFNFTSTSFLRTCVSNNISELKKSI
jgi:hypothetical protein